jgi:hypothetical protein
MSLIQDLRKPRFFNIALFDLIISIILTEIIFRAIGAGNWVGAALTIPIGILTHYLIDTPTTINYNLGLSGPPET